MDPLERPSPSGGDLGRPLLVPRADILRAMQIASDLVNGPTRPDEETIEDAEWLLVSLNEILLSGLPRPEHRFPPRLCPLAMTMSGYYQEFVGEILAETPQAVKDAEPILVAMALTIAPLIDEYDDYSIEFRIDAHNALKAVLRRLWHVRQEFEADNDAEVTTT